jgi:MFS transporter, DHA1 family, inner membrane transport protein
MPISLFALFLSTFAIGTTEFIIAGLLPQVSGDFGVSIPTGGFLVTAYAIGVAIGGPLLSLSLARLPGRTALLLLLAVFTIGQAGCALAPNYAAMLVARVMVAATHGAIFGVGAILATHLVSAERAGRAVSVLLAGVTVANVLGVPAGAAIGTALGWRASFWSVGGLGVVAIVAVLLLVPRKETGVPQRVSLLAQVHVLGRPAVYLTFVVLIFGMIGQFALLTYIVPVVHEVSGLALETIPWLLLLFGVGSTVGVVAGGRLSDWKTLPSLIGILVAQAVIYAAIDLMMGNALAMSVLVFLWGAVGFAFGAPAQARILAAASDAPNLASTLIPSAYNIGIAIGAVAGSLVLGAGIGYPSLPLVGIAASLLAVAAAVLSNPSPSTPKRWKSSADSGH